MLLGLLPGLISGGAKLIGGLFKKNEPPPPPNLTPAQIKEIYDLMPKMNTAAKDYPIPTGKGIPHLIAMPNPFSMPLIGGRHPIYLRGGIPSGDGLVDWIKKGWAGIKSFFSGGPGKKIVDFASKNVKDIADKLVGSLTSKDKQGYTDSQIKELVEKKLKEEHIKEESEKEKKELDVYRKYFEKYRGKALPKDIDISRPRITELLEDEPESKAILPASYYSSSGRRGYGIISNLIHSSKSKIFNSMKQGRGINVI